MTDNDTQPTRRSFLKHMAGAGTLAATGGLAGCGGSDSSSANHTGYGFYLGEASATDLKGLAQFDSVVVHPNHITSRIAKSAGISKPIAYGSLIAVDKYATNSASVELANQVNTNHWALLNGNGFAVNVPGSEKPTSTNSAAVVDIRIPAAFAAMKNYLTGLVDQGYEGVYLDGLDRLREFGGNNFAGLSEAAVKLMGEVSDYAKKHGKTVMVSAGISDVQNQSQASLVEAMKVADVTVIPRVFSTTNDYSEEQRTNPDARRAAILDAAKASGKQHIEIVGVEIARDPAKKLCETLTNYDTLTAGQNISYSVFFDRPLFDHPYHVLPVFPGNSTYLQPRNLEMSRPEIIAANAALLEPNHQQCVGR